MKINLTDQELNEWVASKVLEWKCFKKDKAGIKFYYNKENPRMPWYTGPDLGSLIPRFNPCNDLNHTYLMEDKIREMGIYKNEWYDWSDVYSEMLGKVISSYDNLPKNIFHFIHASARQRVEAAYLTFKGEK